MTIGLPLFSFPSGGEQNVKDRPPQLSGNSLSLPQPPFPLCDYFPNWEDLPGSPGPAVCTGQLAVRCLCPTGLWSLKTSVHSPLR